MVIRALFYDHQDGATVTDYDTSSIDDCANLMMDIEQALKRGNPGVYLHQLIEEGG